MSTAEILGLSYRYPSSSRADIGPLDLNLKRGQVILLTGPTGCGKSTLLRAAAGLLQRHGRGQFVGRIRIAREPEITHSEGSVRFARTAAGGPWADPALVAPSERVRLLGFVSQEPNDQIVAATLGDEIAFGLESAGWDSQSIRERVAALLRSFSLPVQPKRSTTALSGGQKQRLVTAAALAATPPVLLLDEPLAQLDPSAAQSLLRALKQISETGTTVLLVEHRITTCLPYCDRVLLMNDGKLESDSTPADIPVQRFMELGLGLPVLKRLEVRFGTLEDARRQLLEPTGVDRVSARQEAEVLVSAKDLSFSWPGSQDPALQSVNLELKRGERVALVGENGSGKSTLLAAIGGSLPRGSGGRLSKPELRVDGRCVDVPQDPDLTLFCGSVREELAYGPLEAGLSEELVGSRVAEAAETLSLSHLMERAPQALSRGQRLRCAVAAALSCGPDILLLDEPTSGQDTEQIERLMCGLRGPAGPDRLLVFATHDLDLALRHATRIILLGGGRVLSDNTPSAFLFTQQNDALPMPPLASWCRDEGIDYARAHAAATGTGEAR